MNQNRLFIKFSSAFLGFILLPFMLILIFLLLRANRLQEQYNLSQNKILENQTVSAVLQQMELAENMCKTVIQNQNLLDFLDKQYETTPDLLYYRTTIRDFVKVTNGVSDIKLRIYLENATIPIGFGIFYPISYIDRTAFFHNFYQSGNQEDIWLSGTFDEELPPIQRIGSKDTYHYFHKIQVGTRLIGVIEALVPEHVFFVRDTLSEEISEPAMLSGYHIFNYSSSHPGSERLGEIIEGPRSGNNGHIIYSKYDIDNTPFHIITLSDSAQLTGVSIALMLLLPLLFIAMMAGFFAYNRRVIQDIHYCLDRMEYAVEHNFESSAAGMDAVAARKDEISVLAVRINYLLTQIRTLLDQKIQEETAAKQAELLALQHQINPHFLYNTMEIFSSRMELAGLYKESAAVSAFCRMLRYNINSRELMASLNGEIKMAKDYLALQSIRSIPFQVDFQIPDELLEERCIRFLLEPFIENSFKYRGDANPLSITISARIQDGDICFLIENNGEPLSPQRVSELNYRFESAPVKVETDGERIGLNNINSRLKLFYGDKHFIQVSCEGGYTSFRFRIERRPSLH